VPERERGAAERDAGACADLPLGGERGAGARTKTTFEHLAEGGSGKSEGAKVPIVGVAPEGSPVG